MAAEHHQPGNSETKIRVFISYSRKDMAFADRIEAALRIHGFETLIDREEIYAFEDWWKRIEALIGRADTVVFVLSPDAVKSKVALKEVAYAASLNKRFAPIVWRRVEDTSVPEPLRRLNFIFFDDPARFDDDANKLVKALQTDIGWIRQHTVTIGKPFAVAKFDVTFDDWDACFAVGGCPNALDAGFGRGTRPVISVNFYEAQQYAVWLSKMTGHDYRLPTEAEWEYAARANTTTAHYWGDEPGQGNANCNGCGSQWDYRQTAPVGSFKRNPFGLYDMAGNVWQWVQDCYHDDYNEAPADGSAWTFNDCPRRIARGGSWGYAPAGLRSASRFGNGIAASQRSGSLGFRVAMTLNY